MQNKQKTSLVLIDDHPLFRQGVEDLLRLEADFEILGIASTGEEGLSLIRRYRPQIGITDVNLPDLNGLMVVKSIHQERLGTRMILLTAYDDLVQKVYAFQAGAWGYCTKDIQPLDLVERIRAVSRGYYIIGNQILDKGQFDRWLNSHTQGTEMGEAETSARLVSPLSLRELQVLTYLSQGQTNKEIACQLGISPQTVKNHLASLFRKLGVEDRTQAVLVALQRGWIRMQSVETKE